jgi:hypothetical protein
LFEEVHPSSGGDQMSKHTGIGPSQKVRCKGGKHHIDPRQIEGPPRLRTGGGAWAMIELYAKPKGGSPRSAQDNLLEKLFKKTDGNKIKKK